jgi:tetratricopeptide (TPR) repeat protein
MNIAIHRLSEGRRPKDFERRLAMRAIAITVALFFGLLSPVWADALNDLKKGIAADDKYKFDRATKLFTRAIDSGQLSEEDLWEAHFHRGDNLMLDPDSYDQAIADFTRAIEIDPYREANWNLAYERRGTLYEKQGRYDRAIEDLTKAIEITKALEKSPAQSHYYQRGRVHELAGNIDQAIADYRKAIEIFQAHGAANRALERLGVSP